MNVVDLIASALLLALELVAAIGVILTLTAGPLIFLIWLLRAQPPKRPPTDGNLVQLAGD